MKVEYLLAYDDKTWNTVVVDVPTEDRNDRENLIEWAERNLAPQAQYRRVVLFALYAVAGYGY